MYKGLYIIELSNDSQGNILNYRIYAFQKETEAVIYHDKHLLLSRTDVDEYYILKEID